MRVRAGPTSHRRARECARRALQAPHLPQAAPRWRAASALRGCSRSRRQTSLPQARARRAPPTRSRMPSPTRLACPVLQTRRRPARARRQQLANAMLGTTRYLRGRPPRAYRVRAGGSKTLLDSGSAARVRRGVRDSCPPVHRQTRACARWDTSSLQQ